MWDVDFFRLVLLHTLLSNDIINDLRKGRVAFWDRRKYIWHCSSMLQICHLRYLNGLYFHAHCIQNALSSMGSACCRRLQRNMKYIKCEVFIMKYEVMYCNQYLVLAQCLWSGMCYSVLCGFLGDPQAFGIFSFSWKRGFSIAITFSKWHSPSKPFFR